ncbi:MAG TPA: autotransporter domain-containing protein [Rhodanobacteraceae bacterium]
MLRLRHLSVALIAALAVSAAAQAGTTDFNKIVVFGDSLSDAGNLSLANHVANPQPMRFTTNPGQVALQDIANHFGWNLTPSLAGGTDYAFGGAGFINNSPGTPAGVPTITAQITGYLAAAKGMDSHTLYALWGGANDIFYHATATATGGETATQAQAGIAAAAGEELKLLGQMHASGARFVLVFNLPDIGKTPSGTAQGAAGAQGLTGLTLLYNGVLDGGLDTLSDQGLNVIPVNVYGLLNEVIANPKAFGFSNTTVPACLTGPSTAPASKLTSVECGPAGSGAPYTYAKGTDQTYLFADGVHPTTAAHKMLSEYVIAELNAPGQISMLAEAPLASAHAHLDVLHNQMRADESGAGGTRAFVGVSYGRQRFDATGNTPGMTSDNTNLTLGVDAAAGNHFNAGVALGLARNDASMGGAIGGFRLDSVIGSGYALWHAHGGYIGGHVGFAQLSYNNINRRFQIGALTRNETGQTGGSQLMAGLTGGWLFGSKTIGTGPYAGLQWQRIRVDGYNEDGDDSSAMWFGHQQRNAVVGTLGWQLRGNWKAGNSTLHPYINVAWNHDSRADARTVQAGLTGMQGSFALTGFIPDASWVSADLGLAADWSSSVSGWVAYHGRFADSDQHLNSINLGLRIAF